MTVQINAGGLKQFLDSAIVVTNNGLFGSTRLPETHTSVGCVHRAVEQLLNIGQSGSIRKTAVSANPKDQSQIVRSALACRTHAQSQHL